MLLATMAEKFLLKVIYLIRKLLDLKLPITEGGCRLILIYRKLHLSEWNFLPSLYLQTFHRVPQRRFYRLQNNQYPGYRSQ
jgi:hypothetical protein